jgi:hypothetical protein
LARAIRTIGLAVMTEEVVEVSVGEDGMGTVRGRARAR